PDAEQYLIPPTHRSPFDRNLSHVLHELKANPQLRQLIETGSDGSIHVTDKMHATGKMIVQLSRGLDSTELPSIVNIQKTILGAALSNWRQAELGSCHTTATVLSTKDAALELAVSQFVEIIKKGSLTFSVNGKPAQFLATTTMAPQFRNLALQGTTAEAIARDCDSMIHVKKAYTMLGGTIIDVQLACLHLQIAKKVVTITAILEGIAKDKKASKIALEAALNMASTAYEPPILRSWENSVMGMNAIPFTAAAMQQTAQITGFKLALSHTFLSLEQRAQSPNLRDLEKLLANAIPKIFYNDDIRTIDFAAIQAQKDKLTGSKFVDLVNKDPSMKKLKRPILAYNSIEARLRLGTDLTAPILQPLEKIRLCAEPSSDPKSSALCWQLYYEGTKGFEKISTPEELGMMLRVVFGEIAKHAKQAAGKPADAAALQDPLFAISNQEIA
ncbi:MAG TPA: hypothetical protein VN457_06395, partial [Chlamydiales bacterium]|nr:hypothetical protein [Chlamydiales bacterium]